MTEDNKEPKESKGSESQEHHEIHHEHKAKEFKSNRFVLVRYGKMKALGYFRHKLREIPYDVTHLIVNTERGMELGEIIKTVFDHKKAKVTLSAEQIDEYCHATGENYPINKQGRVLRLATKQDVKDQHHLDIDARNEMKFCQQKVDDNKLDMKLVDAEHLFGGERIIFYFLAEGRVDFRDLVKQLAQQYQTRIEMRQVGARDEAKLVADFETCGRECCCKTFLKVLAPVNMRMAKLQKATLDPSKISGRCGRLKCCLRYEDEVYTVFNKRLPKRNSTVKVEGGYGTVLEGKVITQMVTVRRNDGVIVTVHVDDILEKNYKPTKEELQKAADEENDRREQFRRREEKRQAAQERADRKRGKQDERKAARGDNRKDDRKDNRKDDRQTDRKDDRKNDRKEERKEAGCSEDRKEERKGDIREERATYQSEAHDDIADAMEQAREVDGDSGPEQQDGQEQGDKPKKRRRRRRKPRNRNAEGGEGGQQGSEGQGQQKEQQGNAEGGEQNRQQGQGQGSSEGQEKRPRRRRRPRNRKPKGDGDGGEGGGGQGGGESQGPKTGE